MRYPKNAAERLERAEEDLAGAFTWASSPEGHDYWEKVRENLRRHRIAAAAGEAECKDETKELRRQLNQIDQRLNALESKL